MVCHIEKSSHKPYKEQVVSYSIDERFFKSPCSEHETTDGYPVNPSKIKDHFILVWSITGVFQEIKHVKYLAQDHYNLDWLQHLIIFFN